MRSEGRFKQLDGLRGVAAIIVMLYHYCSVYSSEFHAFIFSPDIFKYGFYGVELFFVISGFVIYYTIQKIHSPKEFLIKRFIRLFPTYWLCLVITFLVVWIFPLNEYRNTNFVDGLVNVTMISGVIHVKYVDPAYWSLQIELFFYLLMAVILLFNKLKHIDFILWAWLGLVLIYNEVHKLPGLGLLLNLQFGPLFVAGICFYRIKTSSQRVWNSYLLLVISYGCAVRSVHVEESFLGITIVYLVFVFSVFIKNPVLSSRLLAFFGAISYSLYLIHANVGFVLMRILQTNGFNAPYLIIIPIGFSIFLSWIITFYFEKPLMAWLNKKLIKQSD